jgi:hypothetical protein
MHVAQHLRRLAEQQRQRHVDRQVLEVAVAHHQLLFSVASPTPRRDSARVRTMRLELFDTVGVHRQHVAFLRLVAPDLHRRHAGIVVGHGAQLEARAAAAVVDQFRQCIGQAAGTDVVDRDDGIVRAHGPAAVDDLLARRCISGLPRCTEAKSRSSALAPLAMEEAAPPPRPMSMAGPPSTTICAPGRDVLLVDMSARMLP